MDGLKPLFGGLLKHPIPLELSGNFCSHKCTYCSDIDSPIMLDNLRTIPAGEVKVGDKLFGWDRAEEKTMRKIGKNGSSLVAAREWQTAIVTHVVHRKAKVIRVHLSNGESLVCTPDHHWFTGRTGKYEYQTLVDRKKPDLMRLGLPLLPQQSFTHDYMVGYIRGFAEGDGTWMPQKCWRIASKDPEPLARIASFLILMNLGYFDVRPYSYPEGCQQLYFPPESPVNEMINGLDIDSLEYWRGWLGGIYDAEGNTPAKLNRASPESLRISQYQSINPLTYDRIQRALRLFGFGYIQEPKAIRMYGGRLEAAKFTQLVQPCIERKINPLFGSTMKGCYSKFDVIAIEDWGESDVASFETSTHNYVSAGCLSRNCYANLNAPTRTMDVNGVQNLLAKYQDRNTLEAMLLKDGYPVMISNHIDPFSASNYRQMVPIMEMMTELGIGYSPQTKGGKGWERVIEFMPKGVWYITISHDTEETRQLIEPAAPSLEHRYELIHELIKLGHTVLVGTNPCESEWLKDPIAYFENLAEIGVYGVWLESLHLNTKQRAAMPDRDAARLGHLVKDCLKKKKNPDRLNFLLECRAIAESVGLEINSVGQGNYSLFFEPYKELYEAAFPTTQDMINYCAENEKEFITYREWVDLYKPSLPDFITASNYHYVDSNARMSPELTLGFKTPKNPDFETILKCILKAEKLPNHPCHSLAFSFAVDNEDRRWLDDDGCPILCFNDGGWTHEMIIYDKHPLNG